MSHQRKRQKKGEVEGDFKCKAPNCSKNYLSYPALYTHIKNKHGDQYLGDIQRPSPQGSRGRPKREEIQTLTQEQEQAPLQLRIQIESKQTIDDFLLELIEMDCKFVLQQEAELIKNPQIIASITEVFKIISELYQGNLLEEEFLKSLNQCLTNNDHQVQVNELDNLIQIGCDEAISEFLKELSYTVNLKFLQNIAYFLLSFRYYIITNYEYQITDTPKQFGEYMNNFMRDINIYFSTHLLEQFYSAIGDQQKIYLNPTKGEVLLRKIGLHFCNWLFSARYSSQKLSLS